MHQEAVQLARGAPAARQQSHTERALAYLRDQMVHGRGPLSALLESNPVPRALDQLPRPGINWIGDGLGYYYHSHGADEDHGLEHGHYHLFSTVGSRVTGKSEPPFTHLVGLAVDARGSPTRVFATNLWVTDGKWCSAAFALRRLERFAELAACTCAGAEKWPGMLLDLFPAEVRTLFRQRDARVARWRNDGHYPQRLTDRRTYLLSSIPLKLDSLGAN